MLRAFIEKAAAALQQGYHLLILDLWPPGSFDPSGVHGALWSLVGLLACFLGALNALVSTHAGRTLLARVASTAVEHAVAGTITVNIRVDNGPSPNLTITALGGGVYAIRGDGIPGRTYRIQFSDAPDQTNWQALGTATADTFGIFQFTDSTGSAQRYYRSVYP